MSSLFETPNPKRPQYPGVFGTPVSAGGQDLYPNLPTELSTPTRTFPNSSRDFQTPDPYRPTQHQYQQQPPVQVAPRPPPAPAQAAGPLVQRPQEGGTDGWGPIQRAAKVVGDTLEAEKRYPQLDDIVSQGQSQEYEIPSTAAPEPYIRTATHTIPDAIFEQYNRATSHTLMGLFAELKQAWITVDNRLYMWDYASGSGFQGYEDNGNTITAVRLVRPKVGVFTSAVDYVLVVATTVNVFLIGLGCTPNAKGSLDVQIFSTNMSVSTTGLDVTIIEGSPSTGRIFFGGKADNDIHEFIYQAEERWFTGRCSKVCHTNQGSSIFTPRIPFFSNPKDNEHVEQIVIDDSRKLLYTLSSASTIRAFQIRGNDGLTLSLTHSFSHTIANIRVMVGQSPLLGPEHRIVSISPVTATQARRTHLIATNKTGCRFFMSAVASEYGFGNSDSPPTSMQVIHIRYPPPGQIVQGNVRKAKVFTPGYFFCFLEKGFQFDDLFLAAPDPAKISTLHDGGGATRLQLIEQGMVIPLESRVEACELVSGHFGAQNNPQGFGNELTTQFDQPPSEIAILTNSGVHMIRRRRLVEVFDSILRAWAASANITVIDEAVREFFKNYGRAEGCASALAVACGASTGETASQIPNRVTDVDVLALARRCFIEFGGKPQAENVYDTNQLPSLDSIKVSGRAEGLGLYIARIVRSIWNAKVILESPTPSGGFTYSPNIVVSKLKDIREQIVRLASFLRDNRSFIVGLSGAESLMGASSKLEEVANQAEHRTLHALVTLIDNMIEGISFVLFLFDDKLDAIIFSLPDQQRDMIKTLTYGELFSTDSSSPLARELVTAIVNRNIAAGMNVDTIADALRRKCGSFCSADDVVVFKAVEHLRRAKSESDQDVKSRTLNESLRLFEQSAGGLTLDNLNETVGEYLDLGFYHGAIQLALRVATEKDRGNLALQFLDTDKPTGAGEAESLHNHRTECYKMVFAALEQLDHSPAPDHQDGVLTPIGRQRRETWHTIENSPDPLFHYALYDNLFAKGRTAQLLEVDSPYILPYLQNRGQTSLAHCELLHEHHSRRNSWLAAAEVLHELALSSFTLPLEKRLEFFSQAKSYCNAHGAPGHRQQMAELSQTIQEELDVAMIQDDLLRRVRDDARISNEKKHLLEQELGQELIGLSDLFNRFADPYQYMDICLSIFLAADYRGTNEIRQCWQTLVSQTHEQALSDPQNPVPFELVADKIRTLGRRFAGSEAIFPPADMVPLLEKYAYEQQRDVGPPGWAVAALVDAGVNQDTILRVLEDMFWREETPFTGAARKRLFNDACATVESWWQGAMRKGGAEGFSVESTQGVLRSMMNALTNVGREETDRVDRLVADMTRRGVGL